MRLIDADALYQTEKLLGTNIVRQDKVASELLAQVLYDIQHFPTLTPPNASSDLISRSALLRGETEPEITTGSDSELAEHMEWERWMDKIKRAPAVDKEGLQ